MDPQQQEILPMTESRKVTNRLLDMIDCEMISLEYVLNACLGAMSEDDVKQMVHANEIDLFLDEDDMEQDDEE